MAKAGEGGITEFAQAPEELPAELSVSVETDQVRQLRRFTLEVVELLLAGRVAHEHVALGVDTAVLGHAAQALLHVLEEEVGSPAAEPVDLAFQAFYTRPVADSRP